MLCRLTKDSKCDKSIWFRRGQRVIRVFDELVVFAVSATCPVRTIVPVASVDAICALPNAMVTATTAAVATLSGIDTFATRSTSARLYDSAAATIWRATTTAASPIHGTIAHFLVEPYTFSIDTCKL